MTLTSTRQGADTRQVLRAGLGNTLETYDWLVYSAVSLYFAGQFFPSENRTLELLGAASVFAVGFLARPLGAWLFGRMADRRGRKVGLTASIAIMSASAVILALLPTYHQVGYLAPTLLVVVRFIQGISMGGEYGASGTLIVESARPSRRASASSAVYLTIGLGLLLGYLLVIALQTSLTDDQMESWGWRVPFIVGAAGAIVVFYLRRSLVESAPPDAEQPGAADRRGGLSTLWEYRTALLKTVGLTLGSAVTFYTFTGYLPKYMVNSGRMSDDQALRIELISLVVYMIAIAALGKAGDRWGIRPVLLWFGFGGTFLAFPLMVATGASSSFGIVLLIACALMAILAGDSAVNVLAKAKLFPASVRASGIGIPYALTVAIAGGTAEFIALGLKSIGLEELFFVYVSACCAISLVVFLVLKKELSAPLTSADDTATDNIAADDEVRATEEHESQMENQGASKL